MKPSHCVWGLGLGLSCGLVWRWRMEATLAWERRMVVGVTVGLCGVGGEISTLKTLWVAPNFTREVMSSGSVGRVRER